MDKEEYARLRDAIALDVVILAIKAGVTVKVVLMSVEEETKEIIRDVVSP